MKKGFGLLEILASIAIVGFLVYSFMPIQAEKDFDKRVDDMIASLSSLVMVGIYDNNKGYTVASGGNCSSAFDVLKISAKRIKLCTNLNFELVDMTVGDDTDAEKSFFTYLNSDSVSTNYGCKVYINDISDYTTHIFIDCSTLPTKKLSVIEQKITKQLQSKLGLIYRTSYQNAISFSLLTTGSLDDGRVIIELQK